MNSSTVNLIGVQIKQLFAKHLYDEMVVAVI